MCIDAFLALRRHGSLLVRLCLLMVPAGMPELRYPSDVEYLRDKVRVWALFNCMLRSAADVSCAAWLRGCACVRALMLARACRDVKQKLSLDGGQLRRFVLLHAHPCWPPARTTTRRRRRPRMAVAGGRGWWRPTHLTALLLLLLLLLLCCCCVVVVVAAVVLLLLLLLLLLSHTYQPPPTMQLYLQKDTDEVVEIFKRVLLECLHATSKQLDDMFHSIKHAADV